MGRRGATPAPPRSRRQRLLLLLAAAAAAAAAAPTAAAHRPLLTLPSGGAPYSTYGTALPVPWVTSSWSTKRVVECGAPLFWLKFTAERPNQELHVTAGVPPAPGLAALRPGLALFGPGLPAYNASRLGFPAPPPAPGQGMLRISSPADQSSCAFLENAVSKRFYKPAHFEGVGPRCAYYEPHSRGWLWITADRNATLPVEGGTYYLAAFLDGRKTTGRLTVAVADWGENEDFKRPYAMPAGNRNVSWTDLAATPAAACCSGAGPGGAAAGEAAAAAAADGDTSACPAFSAFGCEARERAQQQAGPPKDVSPATAAALVAADATYVDVQTGPEFAARRAKGAVNVPSMVPTPAGREPDPAFVENVKKLFPPCTKLVIGCRSGPRSQAAAALLQQHFPDVVYVDGGIIAWEAAGLPVEPRRR